MQSTRSCNGKTDGARRGMHVPFYSLMTCIRPALAQATRVQILCTGIKHVCQHDMTQAVTKVGSAKGGFVEPE